METLGLCRPSGLILLISVAAVIYHTAVGAWSAAVWWIMVGLFGTGIFQVLCFGGLEPVAWVLMLIPVLVVCFFVAVALFASHMRITNVLTVPCSRSPTCGCSRCLETTAPTPQVGCSSGFCE
jgi:hypothetical protein